MICKEGKCGSHLCKDERYSVISLREEDDWKERWWLCVEASYDGDDTMMECYPIEDEDDASVTPIITELNMGICDIPRWSISVARGDDLSIYEVRRV